MPKMAIIVATVREYIRVHLVLSVVKNSALIREIRVSFRVVQSMNPSFHSPGMVRVQGGFSTGYGTGLTFKITRFYAGPYGCTGQKHTVCATPRALPMENGNCSMFSAQ